MGLFSRDRSEEESLSDPFEPVPLPNSDDLDEDFLSRDNFDPMELNSEAPPPLTEPTQSPKLTAQYGIAEVTALMRELPNENQELVVTVVKKTLESTQINLDEIIDSAEHKETRLREKTQTLQSEIRDLQQEIEKRNREIALLQQDLKETSSVKEKLELAQQLHNPKPEEPQSTPLKAKPLESEPLESEPLNAESATAKPLAKTVSGKSDSSASPTPNPSISVQSPNPTPDDPDDLLH